MRTISSWIIGAMVTALGVLGLFLSAHADDAIMHATGLLIAGFSVLFVFALVGGHADPPAQAASSAVGERADRAGHDEEIRPLAAEPGVGGAEGVDPAVQPGQVVDRGLDERPHALV